MEMKKSKKADLRSKQGLFLQVGMLVALALVFVSFQWSVDDKNTTVLTGSTEFDYDEVLIPITRNEPKKEEIKPILQPEIFIITDEVDIEEVDFNIDVEATEDMRVAIIPMDDDPEDVDPEVFVRVEQMPEFPGGEKALLSFLGKNTNYPEIAKETGTQGRVYVKFVINKKGEVVEVQLARGVDPSLNEEALRVVRSLPNWNPGKQRGKVVNVAYNVPINFRLN